MWQCINEHVIQDQRLNERPDEVLEDMHAPSTLRQGLFLPNHDCHMYQIGERALTAFEQRLPGLCRRLFQLRREDLDSTPAERARWGLNDEQNAALEAAGEFVDRFVKKQEHAAAAQSEEVQQARRMIVEAKGAKRPSSNPPLPPGKKAKKGDYKGDSKKGGKGKGKGK